MLDSRQLEMLAKKKTVRKNKIPGSSSPLKSKTDLHAEMIQAPSMFSLKAEVDSKQLAELQKQNKEMKLRLRNLASTKEIVGASKQYDITNLKEKIRELTEDLKKSESKVKWQTSSSNQIKEMREAVKNAWVEIKEKESHN
jgi:hypothetical protein